MKPFAAEDAGAVRPEERRHDQVAGLHGPDVGADGLDDADELVTHPPAGSLGSIDLYGHRSLPQMRGAGDPNERVGRLDQAGIGDVLDADVAGAVHQGCTHGGTEAARGHRRPTLLIQVLALPRRRARQGIRNTGGHGDAA